MSNTDALKQVLARAYREGKLTIGEVRHALHLDTREEAEGVLKEHGAYLDYTKEDLREDSRFLRHAQKLGAMKRKARRIREKKEGIPSDISKETKTKFHEGVEMITARERSRSKT
jgi:hypothetical protein